ncbi:tetratricopeptide repeat protein [Micromonospora craniellae]|uniref:XRE family transcriptional regulator n=1 Tax=Micromonospora craniellae TaxID=2294034 RepID=A0A372FRI3_9ACTN|nr:hypothetical protein [Micromonospora craniellae]QOC93910.1 hypothetical protein ID554_09975 [Micromonospora craniellae]RFS43397.1 hypothetical protein D0Q02_28000 [Micromonospora craniellae]
MARSARSYEREADELRVSGWTYRQIASHWQRRYGFNPRVAFRLAHGLTQADVAQRWNEQWPDADAPKTAKQVSYWEIWPGAAGRTPSLDTLNKLAFLYRCAAGELLGGEDYSHLDTTAVRPTESDAYMSGFVEETRPSVLPPAGTVLSRVTERVVDDFELVTSTYRAIDYREGSGRVSADVAAHLRRMLETSNRTTTSTTHRRLLRAAADAAQLAGWLAIDAQRYDQAEGYCRLAASLADKSNDRALHAYSLGVMSYIHLHAGDGKAALRLLETAQGLAGRGNPPAVRSWLHEATGEAYGLLGQPQPGLVALARAERVFDGVDANSAPAWLGFYNADCHAARLKGRCLIRLRQPRDATQALYEALTLLPPTFVRERSGTLIDLAVAYVQMGQVEQACEMARQADTLARRTGSERNRKRLRELLVDLLPWTNVNGVQSLYRQVLLN